MAMLLCTQSRVASTAAPPAHCKFRRRPIPPRRADRSSRTISSTHQLCVVNGANSAQTGSTAAPHRSLARTSGHARVVCRAASAENPEESSGSDVAGLVVLGALFAAWYATNVFFNIYQKQALRAFPLPLTCTVIEFAVGSALSLMLWATGAVKRPRLDAAMLRSIWPLALVHVLGNVVTNISLGAVAVSFTHTIKAMEPFFSVVLSSVFLGVMPPMPVLLTLVPIVGGVVLASLSEVSFNWTGFSSAMASNVIFQSRNVLSKKLLMAKGSLDNINLFQIITIMATLMLLPLVLLVDGNAALPSSLAAMGLGEAAQHSLYSRLLLAGLCFHAYQQVSYMILSRVSPITHSIGNCVKRVVVIIASVIAFQNPMSPLNALGTGIALFGVFLYSQVSRRYKAPKPKPA